LTNNGLKGTYSDFIMVGDRNSNRATGQFLLHNYVATPFSCLGEAVSSKYLAYFLSGKYAQFTQQLPQPVSQIYLREAAVLSLLEMQFQKIILTPP